MLKGTYTTRQGFVIHCEYATEAEARARLAYLDAQEELTQRVAWTDSGSVRFNYNREAEVIRKLLKIS